MSDIEKIGEEPDEINKLEKEVSWAQDEILHLRDVNHNLKDRIQKLLTIIVELRERKV